MKVSVAEAKNKLTQLIRSVEQGERVTICRHGLPVADLVPPTVEKPRAPVFGTLAGKIPKVDPHALEPMTEAETEEFIEGRY